MSENDLTVKTTSITRTYASKLAKEIKKLQSLLDKINELLSKGYIITTSEGGILYIKCYVILDNKVFEVDSEDGFSHLCDVKTSNNFIEYFEGARLVHPDNLINIQEFLMK